MNSQESFRLALPWERNVFAWARSAFAWARIVFAWARKRGQFRLVKSKMLGVDCVFSSFPAGFARIGAWDRLIRRCFFTGAKWFRVDANRVRVGAKSAQAYVEKRLVWPWRGQNVG